MFLEMNYSFSTTSYVRAKPTLWGTLTPGVIKLAKKDGDMVHVVIMER